MRRIIMEKQKRKITFKFLIWAAVLLLSAGGAVHSNADTAQAETTVYVTKTGTKYHSRKCGNGTYTPTTLSNALARGLTPCSKCYSGGHTPSPAPAPAPGPGENIPPAVKPLKISKTSLLLVKGQTKKLKVSNAVETVSWSSSKTSVATVSASGKVKAAKKGTAIITATSGTVSKTCRITVEEPKLSAKKLTLNINQSKKLKLSGCGHSVKWSSSNPSIANIQKGKITAIRAGSAKITAKVHGKKYLCKVSVNKPKVKKITLGTKTVKMEYGQEKKLQLSVLPSYALNYYKFSVKSSDTSVVSAFFDNLSNTLLLESKHKAGKAKVTVSLGGKTVTCTVTIAPPLVKTLTLDAAALTIEPGHNHSISFDIDPYVCTDYYDVIWTTSNSSVATVESAYDGSSYAYIQALREGKADIKLTIGNKTAVCHVVVQP